MENKKLGQESAFGFSYENKDCYGSIWTEKEDGMSKRFYAACAAMQGLLVSDWDTDKNLLVKASYDVADELLKQENL